MDTNLSSFSRLARERRTSKILANNGDPVEHSAEVVQRNDQLVWRAIADAGFAPFHYDRGLNDVVEPWRFHILWQDDCRYISSHLADWFDDMKPSSKLPAMLAACGCLVLVNWIPQFRIQNTENLETPEKQLQVDEEHLAATGAATQNLLLSLTACGLRTYWSSGGFFRTAEMFERLEIPSSERLLSAIFVDYGAADDAVEVIAGKHADARSDPKKWTREIDLGPLRSSD